MSVRRRSAFWSPPPARLPGGKPSPGTSARFSPPPTTPSPPKKCFRVRSRRPPPRTTRSACSWAGVDLKKRTRRRYTRIEFDTRPRQPRFWPSSKRRRARFETSSTRRRCTTSCSARTRSSARCSPRRRTQTRTSPRAWRQRARRWPRLRRKRERAAKPGTPRTSRRVVCVCRAYARWTSRRRLPTWHARRRARARRRRRRRPIWKAR
mmetsp:Transcript_6758/g.27496  ORF Transcript_6758/g.27496 Transcript_6758/m.27496 type:complete len:208 (-) Transcript_6758:510-1133(-)